MCVLLFGRNDSICTDNKRILVSEPLFCQATTWISQLRDATEHNLGDVGRNAEDVESLQQEHEKLEATARVRIISVLFLDDVEVILPQRTFVRQSIGTIAVNGSQRNATQRDATQRNTA